MLRFMLAWPETRVDNLQKRVIDQRFLLLLRYKTRGQDSIMACHSTQALICALDFGRAAASPSSIAARGHIGVAVGLLLAEPGFGGGDLASDQREH